MSGHFSFGGQKCKLRCPRCHGNNLFLSETWVGNGIWFTIENGVMPHDADDHYAGGPDSVWAKCSNKGCRHEWRVRGVSSVSELAIEPAASPVGQGSEALGLHGDSK